MPSRSSRLVVSLFFAALALAALGFLAQPAEGQCLSDTACLALKSDLMDSRQEFRAIKQERKALRVAFRNTLKNSPEREALKDQAKALRERTRDLRRDARSARRTFRNSCRNC